MADADLVEAAQRVRIAATWVDTNRAAYLNEAADMIDAASGTPSEVRTSTTPLFTPGTYVEGTGQPLATTGEEEQLPPT